MSGDVQPRKRKDKRKKKEETPIQQQSATSQVIHDDDINIHVHKERTTGGEFCAKFIFFIVMAIIAVIIGLTITEYRGQTDLDAINTESRFAPLFEGWIDKTQEVHGHNDEDGVALEHSEEVEYDKLDNPDDNAEEEQADTTDSEENIAASQTNEEEEPESEPDEEEDATSHPEEEDATSQQEEDEEEQDGDDDDDTEKNFRESEENNHSEEASRELDEEKDVNNEEVAQHDASEEQDQSEEITKDEDEEDNNQKKDIIMDLASRGGVKVLPDNGAESESDEEKRQPQKRSGAQSVYILNNITNEDDFTIRDDLDDAHMHLENNIPLALSLYTKILEKYPGSPRALYGKAQALDMWADKKRSNELLQDSVKFYLQVLKEENVPNPLFMAAAERCINRMRFVGHHGRAISIHKMLIDKFPDNIDFRNQLAVTYLTINRISEARLHLLKTLEKWPNDGFALVHYGFILKTVDNNLEEAIKYMRKGIDTKQEGVIDGRFYFHLGDALARLGQGDRALEVYEEGVGNKVFISKYQRSLYNVNRLTGRPWWNKQQTPYTKFCDDLEQNWKEIRNEGLAVLNKEGHFKDESENLRDVGDWKQFDLYARGIKHVENCKRCPVTCRIVDAMPNAKSCKRGQVKFSVMHPGTHVWPHCGPTNCRLRIHLGLKVPPKTYIRVAEETRSWEEGKILIFDDSFEHEVWHNGTEFRLVLIIDVWHPELTQKEKQTLSAI